MWLFITLALLISIGYGAAFLMAKKRINNQVDVEELVTKVAKAVAQEVAKEILANQPATQQVVIRGNDGQPLSHQPFNADINMDKIIPIAVEVAAEEVNVDSAVKEEESVDKDIEKSKSKLANFFKGKDKE